METCTQCLMLQLLQHVTELMLQFEALLKLVSCLIVGLRCILLSYLSMSDSEGAHSTSKTKPWVKFDHVGLSFAQHNLIMSLHLGFHQYWLWHILDHHCTHYLQILLWWCLAAHLWVLLSGFFFQLVDWVSKVEIEISKFKWFEGSMCYLVPFPNETQDSMPNPSNPVSRENNWLYHFPPEKIYTSWCG